MMLHPILDMLATDEGYGKVFYQVDKKGALVYSRSCHYLKPKPTETIPAFLDRVAAKVQPGDDVEFSCERGKLHLARITRPAAKA